MGKQKDKEQEVSKLKLFETAIDALPYPFYVIDPKTYRIVLANTSSSSYIGKTCFEATHKRTSPCEGLDHPCGLNRGIFGTSKSTCTRSLMKRVK